MIEEPNLNEEEQQQKSVKIDLNNYLVKIFDESSDSENFHALNFPNFSIHLMYAATRTGSSASTSQKSDPSKSKS